MAEIIVNVIGAVQTNCYFIVNGRTKDAVIIDPADNARLIIEKCAARGIKPEAVLLTHGHFDHIMALGDIRDEFKIPAYACAAEKELLQRPDYNCSYAAGVKLSMEADLWLNDGDEIVLAGYKIKVIATPGHTAGSVCYYLPDEGALFSGDTMFKGDVGRCDLPTGDMDTLIRSIKTKLFTLPGNTAVYPGHGGRTDLKSEQYI